MSSHPCCSQSQAYPSTAQTSPTIIRLSLAHSVTLPSVRDKWWLSTSKSLVRPALWDTLLYFLSDDTDRQAVTSPSSRLEQRSNGFFLHSSPWKCSKYKIIVAAVSHGVAAHRENPKTGLWGRVSGSQTEESWCLIHFNLFLSEWLWCQHETLTFKGSATITTLTAILINIWMKYGSHGSLSRNIKVLQHN